MMHVTEENQKKKKRVSRIDKKQTKNKIKKLLFGVNQRRGIVGKLIIYILLISIGFVYLYPLLKMFSTSFMSLEDLLDSSINWIPSSFNFDNYRQALSVMNINESLFGSIMISLISTLFNVVVTGIVGYGFARYDFPFKKTLLFLMIFSFIIPPQILMMPTYVLYTDLGLLGSLWSFTLPAILGQGIKSTIFILIYYSFFSQTPKSLYEAAEVDGAGEWTCFWRIGVPMATPAVIIVFLFSFVWYWNETYLVNLYLGNGRTSYRWVTILQQLQNFQQTYEDLYPVSANSPFRLNEGVIMAGTVISIIPLLIVYFLLQKYFVESVDNSGITGE